MADSGTAYVVNKCGKNDFNYGSQTINLHNGDRKTVLIYRKKTEGISMFSDAQNRFGIASVERCIQKTTTGNKRKTNCNTARE